MATDRELLKLQQAGALGTVDGVSDAVAVVGKAHQRVISFDVSADADFAERGVRVDVKSRVKSAYFTPATALAAHASAYTTYTVAKRDGAGGSPTTIATTNTATGGANVSLSAFVPQALAVTESATVIEAGGVLTFKAVETSTPTSPVGFCTVILEAV